MKKFLIFPFLFLLFCLSFTHAATVEKQKVNLIYRHTGAGLGRDADILTKELKALGYSVQSCRVKSSKLIRDAKINIFLEEIDENYFEHADKNYFIPNAEWFLESTDILDQFDMILCKTRECERIFSQYHPNTVFMGFTSLDRYKPKVKKHYKIGLHVAGKSQQKGTNAIGEAWENNPQLPGLFLFRYQGKFSFSSQNNMILFRGFVKDSKLIHIQNKYALHLCPSETEGFGQYLMESLSCGAVVVTTDAPPMNEFVKDPRCLAGYTHTTPQNLADNYYVDHVQLGEVVDNLMQLSDEELEEIGKRNRENYLEMKRSFEENIKTIFKLEMT